MPPFKMPARCIRNLKSAPNKPCHKALKKIVDRQCEDGCEWYINDEKANYCFWYYLHMHKGEQHTVTKISGLWSSSVNNCSIAERSALSKITKLIKDK